jgi:hypothetical protein
MTDILSVPVTVKMRIGIEDKTPLASKLVYNVRQWGMAAAVTVHGRSRQQRYTRRADWEYIKECAEVAHADAGGLPYLPVVTHCPPFILDVPLNPCCCADHWQWRRVQLC